MSEILLVNPRRRRATKKRVTKKRRKVTRKRNPVRRAKRRVTRRRRNPVVSARSVQGQLKTASTGALGALGLDIALAYIPLPAALTSGIIGKAAKAAGAIALGVVANKLGVSAANANRMAEGALTVQLHGIGKELLGQFAPGIALSMYESGEGMGYYGSGWNPNTVDNPDWTANNGMGAYIGEPSGPGGIGFDNQLSAYVSEGYGEGEY